MTCFLTNDFRNCAGNEKKLLWDFNYTFHRPGGRATNESYLFSHIPYGLMAIFIKQQSCIDH